MKIIHCADGMREKVCLPSGSVIVLGFFDGVHLGHRALISTARRAAGKNPVAVWTFDTMPKAEGERLTDNEEKCDIFRELLVDYVVFEDFPSLRSLSGEEFFIEHIINKHNPDCVVCGFDFHFGKGAACDSTDLSRFAAANGIRCEVLPPYMIGDSPVSSTDIRHLISEGNLPAATALLGRYYSVTAEVVHGKMLGRNLGYPTINQYFPVGKMRPKNGIYACIVEFSDKNGTSHVKNGVCNIGVCPTVSEGGSKVTAETTIFDWAGDLYGVNVKTSFVEKLRDEMKFSSIEALTAQIGEDCKKAALVLEKEERSGGMLKYLMKPCVK